MADRHPSRAMIWLTILAAPVALAFETSLRSFLFPPEFEWFRQELEPFLTPLAWLLGLAAALASLLGAGLQRRIARRKLDRLPENAPPDTRLREVQAVFLLTASVPQVPAILSTFAYMFGASLVPVLVGIAICTLGVGLQAVRIGSLASVSRPAGSELP
ncbi:MAG: hypothetical protein IT378_03055 [Sandaracinaceae bacterium]|nr:hypothetical protein [Sandaracinaceae bacterium]